MSIEFVSKWRLLVFTAVIAVLAACPYSQAVTILSGPTFAPSSTAPLAGVLQLTTDVDSRISVLVSDGTGTWEKDFYDYTTNHSETLLGFRPGRTNLFLVTVFDKYRNAATASQLLTFVTTSLPSDFPTKRGFDQRAGLDGAWLYTVYRVELNCPEGIRHNYGQLRRGGVVYEIPRGVQRC